MAAPKGNGLDAANDQPAKTNTKNTIDFIALTTNPASLERAFIALNLALLVHIALIVLEVFL